MIEVEKVEFRQEDKDKLYELLLMIPDEVTQEFDQHYQAWKNTWDDPALQIHSNPRMFAQSEEYDRFLSYCKKQGKPVWLLIFSKFEQGDELAIIPIEDLTFDEYSHLMDEIRENSSKDPTDIIPSQTVNWTRYVNSILSALYADYKTEAPNLSE